MPNWCENELAIVGPNEEAHDFANKIGLNGLVPGVYGKRDEIEFLEVFFPTPKVLSDETGETSVFPGWYEWRIENWGTKWDITNFRLTDRFFAADFDGENREVVQAIKFEFDTAWSPPEAAILNISKMYPNLQFFLYYIERAMSFEGYALYRNGQILESDIVNSIIPKTSQFLEEYEYYDRVYSSESKFNNNNEKGE